MPTKNVFVIGAAKCGTTSICKYLSGHPDVIECKIKEPNFFCKDLHENVALAKYNNLTVLEGSSRILNNNTHAAFVTNIGLYESLFKPGKIRLDGSTNYIFSKTSAQEIKQYDKDAKIIAILRDPMARAYSHYKMDVRTGMKVGKFEEEIKKEMSSYDSAEWHNSPVYIKRSIYYPQISRFIQAFGRGQVKVVFFEELISDKQPEIIESICEFIGIPYYPSRMGKENPAKSPRFQTVNRFLYSLGLKNIIRDHLPASLKAPLKKLVYKSDSQQLDLTDLLKIEGLREKLSQDADDLRSLGIELAKVKRSN